MKRLIKHFIKNESGQSVVELALTLPILLLVLCAIIDFGWIFSNKMLITYCSREGARFGMVNATATNAVELIKTKTKNSAPTSIQNNMNVNITFSDTCNPRSGDIKVKVTCTIKALTPLTGIFIKDQNIVLTSECVMKVE